MIAWHVTLRSPLLASVSKVKIMAKRALRLPAKNHRVIERVRESASQRGYDRKWAKVRGRFLQMNPLCLHCKCEGRMTPATEVDHIVPHRGDKELFWDWDNLQALCKSHHSRKTAKGQ